MIVPNYIEMPFVDKNGHLTDVWRNILMQLLQQMQQNLSNTGFVIPSQSTANIALLTNAVNGTMLYNSTTDLPKIKVAGTFKTITTS